MNQISTPEEYLSQLPQPQRATLERIRKIIMEAVPDAVESISYGILMYKKEGQLAAIGAFKDHCSYFPTSYAVMRAVEKELATYQVSKGTIRFPADKALPTALVKKMVLAKLRENQQKTKKNNSLKNKTV